MSNSKVEMAGSEVPASAEAGAEFESLLQYLKQSRGFDFTAYKRSSLMRRVLVRMHAAGRQTFADYLDYLQVDPEEFTRLFNTILINVTSFFRDPQAWDTLQQKVLPGVLAKIAPGDPIRVWSAGCASGEEAYTVAILLAEALGIDGYRQRVKIYGTDVDEEALTEARQGTYTSRAVEEVPPPLLQRYFDRQDDRYLFNKDLRRNVIFGRHDLIQDAPISRVNLLACRNCLMYFNAEAQARILGRFQFALSPGGVLILGKAETLLTHSVRFSPVDVKRRIFTKMEDGTPDDRAVPPESRGHPPDEGLQRLRDLAWDTSPVAQLLVDNSGKITQVNGQLKTHFGVSGRDLGRPLQDLELSYRPFDLRSAIDRAYAERRPVAQPEIPWHVSNGQTQFYDLLVVPVPDAQGTFLGCSITFTDVSRARRLQEEVQRTHQELETALEELQSTNEELETTNEELQSTVEELETTNEELQSTNEELETMNEELQSTNEELQTINDEVRERGEELVQLNVFLESIFTSLRGAVVMLDRELQIHKWNNRAEDMWGLRSDEVLHRNFLNLDIGLPVEQLKTPIKDCLNKNTGFVEVMLKATNRRGKAVQLKVMCTPLLAPDEEEPTGVILVMDEGNGSGQPSPQPH